MVLPTLIVLLFYALAQLSIGEWAAIPFMASLWFYMFYAIPPAFVGYYIFGFSVLESPSGSMVSIPNGFRAWLFISLFYLLLGFFYNFLFRVRLQSQHDPVITP